MVEITCDAGTVCSSALVVRRRRARRPRRLIVVSGARISTVPPAARTFSAQTSHIIPGPYFGYWNSSISVVMSVWLRFGRSAFMTALHRTRFLTRCAAQSAGISVTGTPQTFSV